MARLLKHNNMDGMEGLYKKQGSHNHSAEASVDKSKESHIKFNFF